MIITCESCHKRYLVKDENIGPKGRKVRCVACSHQWLQKPLESFAQAQQSPQAQTIERPTAPQEKSTQFSFGWLLLMITTAFLLSLGYFGRQEIAQSWPNSLMIYDSLGIQVVKAGTGLTIENVEPLHLVENARSTLTLHGDIVNISPAVQSIPTLKVQLLGPCNPEQVPGGGFTQAEDNSGNRCVIKQWSHSFAETRLLPGERMSFETNAEPTLPQATGFRLLF